MCQLAAQKQIYKIRIIRLNCHQWKTEEKKIMNNSDMQTIHLVDWLEGSHASLSSTY